MQAAASRTRLVAVGSLLILIATLLGQQTGGELLRLLSRQASTRRHRLYHAARFILRTNQDAGKGEAAGRQLRQKKKKKKRGKKKKKREDDVDLQDVHDKSPRQDHLAGVQPKSDEEGHSSSTNTEKRYRKRRDWSDSPNPAPPDDLASGGPHFGGQSDDEGPGGGPFPVRYSGGDPTVGSYVSDDGDEAGIGIDHNLSKVDSDGNGRIGDEDGDDKRNEVSAGKPDSAADDGSAGEGVDGPQGTVKGATPSQDGLRPTYDSPYVQPYVQPCSLTNDDYQPCSGAIDVTFAFQISDQNNGLTAYDIMIGDNNTIKSDIEGALAMLCPEVAEEFVRKLDEDQVPRQVRTRRLLNITYNAEKPPTVDGVEDVGCRLYTTVARCYDVYATATVGAVAERRAKVRDDFRRATTQAISDGRLDKYLLQINSNSTTASKYETAPSEELIQNKALRITITIVAGIAFLAVFLSLAKRAERRNHKSYPDERPVKYDSAVFTALYVYIIFYVIFKTWIIPTIIMTIRDGFWMRCLSFLMMPLAFGMMLFPIRLCVVSVCCLFGSHRNINVNSTTHSAIKPPVPDVLPKVIVQMPVYKESFEETIKPSLESIMDCIHYYQAEGGQVVLFINDDGLQLISEADRQERIAYYNKHNIAYIARPPPKLLARRGLFKKASNMNFCLNLALEVDRAETSLGLDKKEAIQYVTDSRPYPILAGGPIGMDCVKNILLVDSDTRVPIKCLHETVGEFEICPNLGFAQHATSVLRVGHNYWEDWLADFTDKLYHLFIALGTANGDPPPLVGHNATLNWEAMKQVSWFDEEVNYRCFWSEHHVSEDFDMSLRMQSADYCGRYVMYTGLDFKEGVSVRVFDEMIKLKKYSYGTGEMIFNKIKDWPRKGLMSPLIKKYLWSSVRIDGKINIFSYLFTYIAMTWGMLFVPAALYLSVLSDDRKHMQITAFEVLCGCILSFGVIGTTTTVLLQFVTHRNSIIMETFKQILFLPIVSLFFSGISYHIAGGLFRYLLDMKAEWGATSKEIGDMEYTVCNFFVQLSLVIKRFWFMYLLIAVFSASIAVLFLFGPEWLDWNGIAMAPFLVLIITHATMPILLDFGTMHCLWIPLENLFCGKRDDAPKIAASKANSEQGAAATGRSAAAGKARAAPRPRSRVFPTSTPNTPRQSAMTSKE